MVTAGAAPTNPRFGPSAAACGPTTASARVLGAILAGGEGRRLGGNKPLKLFHGEPLIAHVIARLCPQVQAMVLSGRDNAAALAEFALPVLYDARRDAGAGPLAGIAAVLRYAGVSGFAKVAIVPCDAPFLPLGLVRLLGAALARTDAPCAVISAGAVPHPTFGLWRPSALAPLEAFLASGRRKLGLFCAEIGAEVLAAEDAGWTDEAFANINTIEDLGAASVRPAHAEFRGI